MNLKVTAQIKIDDGGILVSGSIGEFPSKEIHGTIASSPISYKTQRRIYFRQMQEHLFKMHLGHGKQ